MLSRVECKETGDNDIAQISGVFYMAVFTLLHIWNGANLMIKHHSWGWGGGYFCLKIKLAPHLLSGKETEQ